MKRTEILFLLILAVGQLNAQVKHWEFHSNEIPAKWVDPFLTNPAFNSIEEAKTYLEEKVDEWRNRGFIEISVDSIEQSNDTLHLWMHFGKPYEWVELRQGNVPDNWMIKTGFKLGSFSGSPFNMNAYEDLRGKILEAAANQGYPFASISLKLKQHVNAYAGELYAEKGPLISFDTIRIVSADNFSLRYFTEYLDIHPGQIFDSRKIADISRKLKNLSFASEAKPAELQFIGQKARVVLYLKKKPASRFNLILAVLPNADTEGNLLVTGEGDLQLTNALGEGEWIYARFKQLEGATKSLEMQTKYPYLPLVPLGLEGSFEIFLKDSQYLDRNYLIGVTKQINPRLIVAGFYENKRSSVLDFDTAVIIQSRELPDKLDVTNALYGLRTNYNGLDYDANPRNGWAVRTSIGLGTSNVRPNTLVTELNDPLDPAFEFNTLYDSLNNRKLLGRYELDVFRAFPVGENMAFTIQSRSGMIRKEEVYTNELYRLGGNSIMRGFNEEEILADIYSVLSIELRYLGITGPNSRFYLFWDGGYMERNVSGTSIDRLMGYGAGISFETRAGIFGLSYALGNVVGESVQFKNSKIHFGYLSRF